MTLKKETDEEFKERMKREADIIAKGYRCGECDRIRWCREDDRWECEGAYESPSTGACPRFSPSGSYVEGTFPDGIPYRLQQKRMTNHEHLLELFKDEDRILDYLATGDCCDCEHERRCPLRRDQYKEGTYEKCREYWRRWLKEEWKG